MILSPYDYQEQQIISDAELISKGKRCIINQLHTGAGKTVQFATIAHRFLTKSPSSRVMILVHLDKLLTQVCETVDEWYGTPCQTIIKGNDEVYDKPLYIGMVETVYRRLLRNQSYFPDINLLIIDECHLGNFTKIKQFFPNAIIIGFTATPISSNRKIPINTLYDDIVVGPQVSELIRRGFLCQNITYSIDDINRSSFKVKGKDYDELQVAQEYSKIRHVKNVVDKYEQIAPDTKTICYNVNKAHSKLVMQAFRERGYDCRHIDSDCTDDERHDIFSWFETKDKNIMCNVGIATMAYDNKYIENIITNFSSISLAKVLQCWGRGGRPCPEIRKTHFSIIDMGGNGKAHGDWNMDRDWKKIFHNPKLALPSAGGAPYKNCPKCKALVPIQTGSCPYCEYQFPRKQIQYDSSNIKLELITKNLKVDYICETNSGNDEYYSLFYIENNLLTQAKYKLKTLNDENAQRIIETFLPLAEQWCKIKGKNWKHFEKWCKKHIIGKLEKQFGYIQKEEHISNIEQLQSIYPL